MSLLVTQTVDRWAVLLMLCSSLVSVPSSSQEEATYYVASSMARLRESPEKKAPILETLRIGAPVRILSELKTHGNKQSMVKVQSTRFTGYVSKRLLSKHQPSLKQLMKRYENATSVAQKRQWIERATAIAPSNEQVIGELVATLKEARKPKVALFAEKGLIAAERRNLSWDGPLYPIVNGVAFFPAPCPTPTATAPKPAKLSTIDPRSEHARYTLRARAFPWVNSGKVVSITEKGYRTQKLYKPICSKETCGANQLAYVMEKGHTEGALVPSWLVAGHRVEPLMKASSAPCEQCRLYRNQFDDFSIVLHKNEPSVVSVRHLSQWKKGSFPQTLPPTSRPVAVYSEREYEWYVLWETHDSRPCCPNEKQVWTTRLRLSPQGDLTIEKGRVYSQGHLAGCHQTVFQTLPGEPRCERLAEGCALSPP